MVQQERPNISELEAQLAITEERMKKFQNNIQKVQMEGLL